MPTERITAPGLTFARWVSIVIHRVVKASMHLGFGAFFGMAGLTVGPAFGALVLASLPLLSWSRIRVGRRSVREVFAGTALGLASGALSVAFFPPVGWGDARPARRT